MNPVDLDYQQSEYAALIAIDWEANKYVYANPDEP
jgi:ribose 1,5-bisphosphokinase PhnN